ncbi:MAG: repeat-containing protein [Bryobacterales bacterium]|nr:repeat-containing protein [Bryobacterales bacterium]
MALAIDERSTFDARLDGVPSPESVQIALEKILASRLFTGSLRYSRFLRFAVEETLQNRGDSLKEYVLAVNVFNRKDTFNPHEDPIVRVEASRLRARLKKYYEGDGRDETVAIEFPKGTYTPVFRYRSERVTDYEPPSIVDETPPRKDGRKVIVWVLFVLLVPGVVAGWMFWPGPRGAAAVKEAGPTQEPASIAVLPFVNDNPDKATDDFSDGLTDELINALAKTKSLRVVARTSVFRYKGKMEDVRKIGRELNVATVLEGSVRKAGNRLRISMQLIDVPTGYNRWSDTYEYDMQDVFNVQERISRLIVNEVMAHKGGSPGSRR